MSITNSILRRAEGFESICNYDISLLRLKCYYDDVYYGITSDANTVDLSPQPPVFACRFCTTPGYEEILALTNEDGKITFQDTRKKEKTNQFLQGTQAHCNAIFDIAWMPGELKIITASGDHTARLWDVSTSFKEIKQIGCFDGHTRSVKTAVFRYQDKAVFATGARDGSIMLWDVRANHTYQQYKPDNCITHAHSIGYVANRKSKILNHASRAQSITGLVFQDDFTLLSCAAGDGLIKVWDLRKNYTVHKKEPVAKHSMNYAGNSTRNGFSSLLICPARITLFANCMDNIIYAYNISSYNSKPMAEYYGHQNRTYYVKACLSSDGRYLASGSSDELAYIWRTSKPGLPLVKLTGHREEVTCIAWCNKGETKIVTCCDDSCHRIWRVGLEHKIENEEVKIDGQAEAVLYKDVLENEMKLETTPTISRRWIINRTPDLDTLDFAVSTPGSRNEDDVRQYTNASSSVKRGYLEMMTGKSQSILSPIQENLEMSVKRFHMENRGARRLFSSNIETNTLNKDSDADESSTSHCTSTVKNATPFSPTLDLPNFVVDGTAPHLLQMSPQKCKENVDWLTKIRKERYEQKPSKIVIDKSCSPKTQTTPARRFSRSGVNQSQKETKSTKTSAISLLNFFKVASNKDCEKIVHSENTNIISSTTTS